MGWINNKMGFLWLTTLFNIETKKKAKNRKFWRLLILNGYKSYINMNFLNWYYKYRILVAAFLPYLTY
jgi:hypothetical protein